MKWKAFRAVINRCERHNKILQNETKTNNLSGKIYSKWDETKVSLSYSLCFPPISFVFCLPDEIYLSKAMTGILGLSHKNAYLKCIIQFFEPMLISTLCTSFKSVR